MADLSTQLLGLKMKNPTVLAAGFLGISGELLVRVVEEGAGAVTMKPSGPYEREGNANPCVIGWDHGLANCVGLPSPGYKNMEEEWSAIKKAGIPYIAGIYGGTVEEFVEVAQFAAKKNPPLIEVNISCPNTKEHGIIFGTEPDSAFEVIEAVKRVCGKVPVMAKLTPNTHKFIEVAKACEEAGADALSAINTVGPGMFIDIETGKPVLSFKTGGLSGPAVRPIAINCVYRLYENVKVPIVGMGGVECGRDAIEMIMAGATCVGIGSAIHKCGVGVFRKVCAEMEGWMDANSVKSPEEIRGRAHE